MGQVKDEADRPARPRVVITSYRRRLLDKVNRYGGAKSLEDALRYAGILDGDTDKQVELEVNQVQVHSPEEERTEITISKWWG